MLVRIIGFGSVWSLRVSCDEDDPRRFARATYYNTTGLVVNGKPRRRWTHGGDIRFCGTRSGFDPNYPSKALGRTFECFVLGIWQGHSRVTVRKQVRAAKPDCYLVVTDDKQTGGIDTSSAAWKSNDTLLLSLSQWKEYQEILLLMPAYGWVRGRLGTFYLEPGTNRDAATLRLSHCV
jgi:hypothetical protein